MYETPVGIRPLVPPKKPWKQSPPLREGTTLRQQPAPALPPRECRPQWTALPAGPGRARHSPSATTATLRALPRAAPCPATQRGTGAALRGRQPCPWQRARRREPVQAATTGAKPPHAASFSRAAGAHTDLPSPQPRLPAPNPAVPAPGPSLSPARCREQAHGSDRSGKG